jgi:hypothetical protein
MCGTRSGTSLKGRSEGEPSVADEGVKEGAGQLQCRQWSTADESAPPQLAAATWKPVAQGPFSPLPNPLCGNAHHCNGYLGSQGYAYA